MDRHVVRIQQCGHSIGKGRGSALSIWTTEEAMLPWGQMLLLYGFLPFLGASSRNLSQAAEGTMPKKYLGCVLLGTLGSGLRFVMMPRVELTSEHPRRPEWRDRDKRPGAPEEAVSAAGRR